MVKEILLTKGYVALVDDADFEFVNQFKWSVVLCGEEQRPYARHAMVIDGDWFDIKMHRLIAAAPSGVDVDHWDGDGLNNQRENLRRCSKRQNLANSKARGGRQYKGVQKTTARSYSTQISTRDQSFYLGSYDTAAEAAKVYDAAAKRIHGQFALSNFPEIDPAADEIAVRVLAGGEPPDRSHMKKNRRLVTDGQVRQIRERYAAGGVDQFQLATEYGLKASAVSHIITGRTFKDVGEPVSKERRRELHITHLKQTEGFKKRRKLTPEQVTEIRSRYQPRVVTASQLADEFNVSAACIYSIVGGYTWKDEVAA